MSSSAVPAIGFLRQYRGRKKRIARPWRSLPRTATCEPNIVPRVEARAWTEPDASEMHVHVAIALAVLGTIVTYGGTLKPAE